MDVSDRSEDEHRDRLAQQATALIEHLVGERSDDVDDLAWFRRLSDGQPVLTTASSRVADARAEIAYRLYQGLPGRRSYAKLATLLGVSRSLAQQLVERGRARPPP
ncbi:MAG: hypothetical protein HOV94_05365 [Saccharothrix sp.]|nr:hypothetical protein [Saccharothrix sp.]